VRCARSRVELELFELLLELALLHGVDRPIRVPRAATRPNKPFSDGTSLSEPCFPATPFNVAVGGTMFNEGSQASKYWGATAPLAETGAVLHPGERVERELPSLNVWQQCGALVRRWRRELVCS